ncbi:hypothetical protein DFS33DRAFT_1378828 [Desarmillaria ectypa]|nr:hypothetical protein DFS33DRAFT_1378828 [Desarmillaria ectypa]
MPALTDTVVNTENSERKMENTTTEERGSKSDLLNKGASVIEAEDASSQPLYGYMHSAKSKRRFGVQVSPLHKPSSDESNYEEKYPEDVTYEEMGPNARVFRTYLDERAIFDANMIEKSRDNVDVLLVFAGLFSASLQADYAEISANLLFEIISIQRALTNGASLDTIAASPLNPNMPFIATTTSVWVNGLWFTSLTLSLTTALVSVLVKQWLHHYMLLPFGTPRERSLLRQFRYEGLQKWRVLVIIGLLPVLMHTSLAIFFVGLVIYLGPLQITLAWIIGIITTVAYTAYLMAHILPLIFPQCPYRTSLCDLVHATYSYALPNLVRNFWHTLSGTSHPQFASKSEWKDLKEVESEAVQSISGDVSLAVLYWLYSVSSNQTVQSIAVQAIAGLDLSLKSNAEQLFATPSFRVVWKSLLYKQCLQFSDHGHIYKPLPGLETKLERLLRCAIVVAYDYWIDIEPPQTDNIALVASIHAQQGPSSDFFTRVVVRYEAVNLIHNSMNESQHFHPSVWAKIIQNADEGGAFSPIDIDTNDSYAIQLCYAVLGAFLEPSRKDVSGPPSVTETAVSLHVAIRQYLFTDMTNRLLKMFTVFVRPANISSLSPSLRVLLVFAEFLIPRLPLQGLRSDAVELRALRKILDGIDNHDFASSEVEDAAVFDGIDRFITDTLKLLPSAGDDFLYWLALSIYSRLVSTRWHTISPRSLHAVVDFMFSHYNSKQFAHEFRLACDIIARGLREGSMAMYDVFRVIESYLSTIVGHGSGPGLDAVLIQQHIEHLHSPDNLFAICSSLAVNGPTWLGVERRKIFIKDNILSLARIQPHNPAWHDCRHSLEHLLMEEGMGFFHLQAYVSRVERMPLSSEDIEDQRRYIRFAIKTLDAFFSGERGGKPVSVSDDINGRVS